MASNALSKDTGNGALAQTTATELLKTIRQLGRELKIRRAQLETVNLDTSLDNDLGLDSLTRMEFIARVEAHFQVTLPQNVFANVETPRELVREILQAKTAENIAPITNTSLFELDEPQSSAHTAKTLIDVLDWNIATHPDRPHIRLYSDTGEGEAITYRQLKKHADMIAAGLQHRGLKPKQAVSLMLPTGKEYFYTFFGILIAGGIPVPIYPPARLNQIEDHLLRHTNILSNCRAVILVTVPEARQVARLLKSRLEHLHTVATASELISAREALLRPKLGTNDIAFLQYTSGSTGIPKGVTLSHANLLANIRAMGEKLQVDSTDTFVSWLPLYHDMGLIGAWLGSLYHSAVLVIMSPLDFLTKPERWLWAIHRNRGTLTAAPNFAYELCLKRTSPENLKDLDLSSLRSMFSGAEPVSPNTLQHFDSRFSQAGLRFSALKPVYGLAECSLGLTFPPPDRGPLFDRIDRNQFMKTGIAKVDDEDPNALCFVSCGEPLPGHEIRIVDSKNRELPERHQGRLQFQGPSTTSGYFRNPDQTRALFHKDWLNSGDLAYIANGEVFLTGRSKDLIIHAGRNIYPQELEEATSEIPGIRKGCVAVFGNPTPETGTERLIVLAETRETDAEERRQLRSKINSISVKLIGSTPDEIVLAPPHTVLKTSSGKIRRSGCREIYEKNLIGKGPRSLRLQIFRLILTTAVPQLRQARRAILTGLYALYSWAVFLPLSSLTWFAVVLCPVGSWGRKIIRASTRILAGLTGTSVSIEGLENLPEKDQPCILICNHSSYLDGPVLLLTLPLEFSFVAKNELIGQFISRTFLRRLDTQFVERFEKQKGVADSANMTSAARLGKSLLFFPEGTFTRMPGLLPFYMGAFKTATESGLPIVPIVLRGTRSILRAGSWFPHRGVISVVITQAIDPNDVAIDESKSNWEIALELRKAARQQILNQVREPDLSA